MTAKTTPNQVYTQGTGSTSTSPFITVFSQVTPSPTSINYEVGQRWVDIALEREYILANFISTNGVITANWIPLGSGGGSGIQFLTGNSGGPVGADVSNNINVLGDGTSINIVGNAASHSLTANVILPAANTVLYSETSSIGGIALNDGYLVIGSANNPPVGAPLTAGSGITITNAPGSITISSTGGGGSLDSLTPDSGGAVSPVSGTIDVTGYPQTPTTLIKGVKTYNGGSNVFQIANLLAVSPYVVGTNANIYNYTSIQTAITAAVTDGASATSPAIVYVTPGTYTQNLTFQPYVHLVGIASGDGDVVNVVGTSGSNIFLGTPSLISITNINFVSNSTSFAFYTQGASTIQELILRNVSISVSQGSSGAISLNSFGVVNIYDSIITSTSNGSGPLSINNGTNNFYNCIFNNTGTGTSSSNGGIANFYFSTFNDNITNLGGTVNIYSCYANSGAQSFYTNAGSTANSIYDLVVNSTASSGYWFTNVGGAGLNYGAILPIGSATEIQNTVSKSGHPFQVTNLSFDGGYTTNNINGGLWIGSTSGPPVATTLTAGTGITITNAANSITINSTSSGALTWTDEATSFAAASNNGYFITATLTATLPASPSQGDVIAFLVDVTPGNLTIQANTGQFIDLGLVSTAAAGTAVNTQYGDSITLVYRASDTSWFATSSIGTWTLT